MRYSTLATILRVLAVVLIVRVLAEILSNYGDYFPPNFDAIFLQGRESTFRGTYRFAFYVHLFSAPFVLVNGLVLLSTSLRRPGVWHRWLGRVQVAVLLMLVLPSSVIMSRQAIGGWWMLRCYVLICSAVALRLISGLAEVIGVANAELAYIVAAWCSWLLPLMALEFVEYLASRWSPRAVESPKQALME